MWGFPEDSHWYGYKIGMGWVRVCDISQWSSKILWRFRNVCEIEMKHAISVIVAVLISPNTIQSVICFTYIFSSLSLINTRTKFVHIIIFIHDAVLYIHNRQYT